MESLHEYVLKRLEESKGELPTVARESGVPYRTLQKIASRQTKNPGFKHVDALYRYFQQSAAA